MGIVRTMLFLVGTTVGAGFLTGAELVRFFSASYLPALALSCIVYFLTCSFFLRLGRKYNGFSGAMKALVPRGNTVAVSLLLAVCFVPCAGMLAGLDALLPTAFPIGSIAGICIVMFFLHRGMKGMSLLNLLLVPLLLLFVLFSGRIGSFAPISAADGGWALLYAFMNTAFAAPAIMEAGKEGTAPIRSSLLAAAILFCCGAFVMGGIVNVGEEALTAPMPYLVVMKNNRIFLVAVACAILTSLASALLPLMNACDRLAHGKKNAAKGLVLLAAFLLSRLGLTGVIDTLYPAVGIFGAVFSAFCVFEEYFFKKYHERIHSRRQKAKNKRCAHDKIQLEHLASVDDQIAESGAGDDVFSHDRTNPRHSHVDFEHGNDGRIGGRQNKLP